MLSIIQFMRINYQAYLWFFTLVSFIVWQFYIGWVFNSNETTNLYLQFARGLAYSLLIILVLLWLPVLRNLNTVLSTFKVAYWLPIKHAKSLHKWLGHVIFFAAIGHGVFYLFYFDSLEDDFIPIIMGSENDLVRSMNTTMYEFVTEDESIEVVQDWVDQGRDVIVYHEIIAPIFKEDCTKCHNPDSTMTYAVTNIPLNTYDSVESLSYGGVQSRQFRINISGISMLVLFIIIWCCSLKVIREKYFNIFRATHKLGYFIAILSLLHIPSMQWIVAPCALLLIEWILNRFKYKNITANIEKINEQFLLLNLGLDKKIQNKPGYYIQIRSRLFKDKQWHDFSLTGLTNNKSEPLIKIQKTGKWTKQLFEQDSIQMDVRGPWSSPVAFSRHKKSWLLISGGVGVTPMLSLLHGVLTGIRHPKQVKFIWVLREPKLLNWLQPLVKLLIEKSLPHVKIIIFLTNKEYPDWLMQIQKNQTTHLILNKGRPDFDELFTSFEFVFKPTIFTCGPNKLMQDAKSAGTKKGWFTISEQF
ncbi:MAG: ferric reductase-like transmembrane domain-containing protein [Saccharospirillaceae bacterium]|nr:ferric reductase-like transmembrane domain-containing protein [Saccharospirillaceae bacterium]